MKKFHLPDITRNPSLWGRWLLAAGLLLVSVQGLLQLYEVRHYLFPCAYHELKLKLINEEYSRIETGLQSLKAELDKLQVLRDQQERLELLPTSRSSSCLASPPSGDGAGLHVEATWQSQLHATKKAQVYVAQKMNYIRVMLESMDRSLQSKLAGNKSASSTTKPEVEKILQQVQKDRTLLQRYHDDLNNLSEQLIKLEKCDKSS